MKVRKQNAYTGAGHRSDDPFYRHPESNERKLMLSLTDDGAALKEKARRVPAAMQGYIPFPTEDLYMLKDLLDRALASMSNIG